MSILGRFQKQSSIPNAIGYVIWCKAELDKGAQIPSPGTKHNRVVVFLDKSEAQAAAKDHNAEVIENTVAKFQELAKERTGCVGPYEGILLIVDGKEIAA